MLRARELDNHLYIGGCSLQNMLNLRTAYPIQIMIPIHPVPQWSLSEAKWALFWCASLTFTSLTIVSFPQKSKHWFAISTVLATACGAFRTGEHILPDAVFVDYYLRFIIILASHITWLIYSGTLEASAQRTGGGRNPWLREFKILFNPRGIGQTWELPHLWPAQGSVSCSKENAIERERVSPRSTTKQSKASALLTHLGHVVLNFTILCIYYVRTYLAPYLYTSRPFPSNNL